MCLLKLKLAFFCWGVKWSSLCHHRRTKWAHCIKRSITTDRCIRFEQFNVLSDGNSWESEYTHTTEYTVNGWTDRKQHSAPFIQSFTLGQCRRKKQSIDKPKTKPLSDCANETTVVSALHANALIYWCASNHKSSVHRHTHYVLLPLHRCIHHII